MRPPLLKLRGVVRAGYAAYSQDLRARGRHIKSGPLKGCWVHPSGVTCKIGRGFVLQFKPVIRVRA